MSSVLGTTLKTKKKLFCFVLEKALGNETLVGSSHTPIIFTATLQPIAGDEGASGLNGTPCCHTGRVAATRPQGLLPHMWMMLVKSSHHRICNCLDSGSPVVLQPLLIHPGPFKMFKPLSVKGQAKASNSFFPSQQEVKTSVFSVGVK